MIFPSSVEAERSILGGILLNNSAYSEASEHLKPEDFSLDSHRRIYSRMIELAESSQPIDMTTLAHQLESHGELEKVGGVGYVSGLVDGVPERPSIKHYIDIVRKHAHRRRLLRRVELLQAGFSGASDEEIDRDIESLLELSRDGRSNEWQSLFHSYEEITQAPPARFAIEGFLQEEGITLIGGLAGHGKTLCMLAMVRALLEGGKLFHHFPVNKTAERVIYLIPEAGLGPFAARLNTFKLQDYTREKRLFVRTLSAKGQLSLNDPLLLRAVDGADLFLDTAIRFMEGDENSAAEQKQFAEALFSLQRAGARTITGAHHSPKGFSKDTYMSLENVLRGSGDIGAMLCTAWGLSQIDATSNRIFVQNVKARDFAACEPFILQGRPSLDQTGYFELTHSPGFAGSLLDHKAQSGRKESPDKEQKIAEIHRMKAEGLSCREIATALNISKGTVSKWAGSNA